MKKYILKLALFVLFAPFAALCQPDHFIQWQKSFGSAAFERANSVFKTFDGGYIIAGTTNTTLVPDGDIMSSPPYQNEDFWVVKVDSFGTIQWERIFGGSGQDVATSVIQTNDGGFIVAGYTNSGVINISHTIPYHGGYDYLVIKLFFDGSIQWVKSYGGSGSDEPSSIIQSADGSYIIAGKSSSVDYDVTDHIGSGAYYDAWLVKTEPDTGTIMWAKSYGGTMDDGAASIAQTSGGYALACYSNSSDNNVPLNYGFSDYWIVKLFQSGQIDWQKVFGGSGYDKPYKIIPALDNGFLIAGSSNSKDYFVAGNHSTDTTSDYWVVKTDSLGTFKWQKCIGGTGMDIGMSVVKTPDSCYIVGGSVASVDGDIINNHGSFDYGVFKLSGYGDFIWGRTFGGLNDDILSSVVYTPDNGCLAVGHTMSYSNSGDVLFNHSSGMPDFWVLKLKAIFADFIKQKDTVCQFEILNFINKSTGAMHYNWLVNNMPVDTSMNLTYTFLNTGPYTITLIAATQDYTQLDTISKQIFVKPTPAFSLGGDFFICPGISTDIGITYDNNYLYHWSTSEDTSIISVSDSGTYYITVTDKNSGCFRADTIIISEYPAVVLNTIPDKKTCIGDTVTLDAGYSPDYYYSWSTGSTDSFISVTNTGTYYLTVTGLNNCKKFDTINVTFFPPPHIITDSVHPACNGTNNGEIYISMNDGFPPYNYSWSNAAQTEDVNNLAAGVYYLTVLDSIGCKAVDSMEILSEDIIVSSIADSITCFGSNDGSVVITSIAGGTEPYNFIWSNGQTTQAITNLKSGAYSCTVSDAFCNISFIDTVIEPLPLVVVIDSVKHADICGTSTGAIYTTASGGTPPYSYYWSEAAYDSSCIINVFPKDYFVTVTDSNGCTAFNSATVYDNYCQLYVIPGIVATSICDTFNYVDLSPIFIIENEDSSSGFIKNQNNVTLIFNAPQGFSFNPDSGYVYSGNGLNDIMNADISVDTGKVTVTFSTGSAYNRSDTLMISGIEVRAKSSIIVPVQKVLMASVSTAVINGSDMPNTVFAVIKQSGNMKIKSVVSYQADSANIVRGSLGNEIIGINIKADGNCGTPLTVNEFKLNTAVSDNPSFNITEAKIYYTGNSPDFAAVNLLGTRIKPNGPFKITAATPQILLEGNNFFWLAYDVRDSAVIDNYLDGECVSVIIDSIDYPADFIDSNDIKRKISELTTFSSVGSGLWSDPDTWGNKKIPGWYPDEDDNVVIDSGNVVTLSGDASCVDLTIISGKLILGSYQFTISGNLAGAQKDSIISTSSSKLVINDFGAKDQFPMPDGVSKIQKITLNRAAGSSCDHDIDLDDNVHTDSIVLVLSNGDLIMSSGKKVLMNSKAIRKEISSSNDSYVDGIVSRNIKRDAGFYIYPLGNNDESRPFGIATQSGNSDNINEVQFFWSKPLNYDYVDYSKLPGGIADKLYWKHNVVSGANTKRRIYYHDSDFPELDSAERVNNLMLANNSCASDTTKWSKETTPWTVDDNTGKKYVEFQSANASNDEYWTFGSKSYNSPLPIELYSFTAKLNGEKVDINWITISETNNDYFTVEKAGSDMEFSSVLTVDGAGNSYSTLIYQATDDNPLEGTSYYRLRQTDFDGQYSYSVIQTVVYNKNSVISVYPNPVRTVLNINVSTLVSDRADILLYDIKGSKIYENSFTIDKGENSIDIDLSKLNHNIFILKIDFENNSLNPLKKVIVKI